MSFVSLMLRYVVDYTNAHDQTKTVEIMEPDYRLRMGDHVLVGRDDAYAAATAKQMRQFPGLVLTVHEIATSNDRLVMRFSEHGASQDHDGKTCAWGGIGLYAWNGKRLTQNHVEQDYFSRRQQLRAASNIVEHPAIGPWDTKAMAPDPAAAAIARDWLESGAIAHDPTVLLDDQWLTGSAEPLIDQSRIELNDFFSCGGTVAFHLTQYGGLIPAEGFDGARGDPAYLHMAGMVRVEDGAVTSGRIIRNRLDLSRRLRPR